MFRVFAALEAGETAFTDTKLEAIQSVVAEYHYSTDCGKSNVHSLKPFSLWSHKYVVQRIDPKRSNGPLLGSSEIQLWEETTPSAESLYAITRPPSRMLYATPDEWSFEDWTLVATALRKGKHEQCLCYECDTIDSLLADIAWYWDLGAHELQERST